MRVLAQAPSEAEEVKAEEEAEAKEDFQGWVRDELEAFKDFKVAVLEEIKGLRTLLLGRSFSAEAALAGDDGPAGGGRRPVDDGAACGRGDGRGDGGSNDKVSAENDDPGQ